MVNPAVVSHSEVPAGATVPPPLRLWHILLLTAVAAVVITARRVVIVSNELPTFEEFTASWVIRDLVTSSAALTLAGLGLSWRRPGWSFLQQPGHWLLAFESVPVFRNAVWDLYWINGSPSWMVTFLIPIPDAVALLLLIVAAWKGFDSRWWRAFFLAQITLVFVPLLVSSYVQVALYLGSLLPLLCLASLSDVRTNRRRDWLSWAGVAITMLNLATGVMLWALWAVRT